MRIGIIDANGRLDLSPEAGAFGFRPGTTVRVLVASSGSSIISLDDTPVTLEAPARALPARERRMLGAGR